MTFVADVPMIEHMLNRTKRPRLMLVAYLAWLLAMVGLAVLAMVVEGGAGGIIFALMSAVLAVIPAAGVLGAWQQLGSNDPDPPWR